MIRVIQELKIEVSKPNFIQAIVAKQYDNNSRFLKVTLVNGNEEITVMPTSTVTINAKRKDGESKAFAGEVNNDGTVTVPLTYWMLELDGTVNCDISVVDIEGRKLTTTTFVMSVERASFNGGEISDDENYDILVKLIEDVNKAKPDLEFDPESENAQSGIAVAQALSGASGGSGISAIVEEVNASELDYGVYYIDGNEGGYVILPDKEIDSGTVFVSPYIEISGKQVTICGISTDLQLPIITSYVYGEDGNYMDIYDEFVSKTYIDMVENRLQKQIDELKNTPTIHTEIELNNKGELVYSWYRDATTGGNVTKSNDGWSVVGYSKSASSGVAYTHFAIVGKTQQSVITNATQTESGTLTYNGIVYYYTVKKIATQYVTDYGKALQLEETYTDNNTLATKVLDYYYGVA